MITVTHTVGRLVEVRIRTPVTAEEIGEMAKSIQKAVQAVGGAILGVVDLRGANVFPADLADRITNFLRQDSPNIDRAAYLVNDSAVFGMQIERVLREAKSPKRRAFRDRREAEVWLGELLTAAERGRTSAFFDEGEKLSGQLPATRA